MSRDITDYIRYAIAMSVAHTLVAHMAALRTALSEVPRSDDRDEILSFVEGAYEALTDAGA